MRNNRVRVGIDRFLETRPHLPACFLFRHGGRTLRNVQLVRRVGRHVHGRPAADVSGVVFFGPASGCAGCAVRTWCLVYNDPLQSGITRRVNKARQKPAKASDEANKTNVTKFSCSPPLKLMISFQMKLRKVCDDLANSVRTSCLSSPSCL